MTPIISKHCVFWYDDPSHLREAALVVQDPQYPMGLCGDEVDAGLVVTELDVLPGDLLPAVLLLQVRHIAGHMCGILTPFWFRLR